MTRQTRAALTVALVLAALPAAAAAPPEDKLLSDGWYELRIARKKVGYFRSVDKEIQYQGRTVHYSSENGVMQVNRGDDVFHMTNREKTWCELDGRLIKTYELQTDGDQLSTTLIQAADGALLVTKTLDGRKQTHRIPVPKGVVVTNGVSGWLLKQRGFKPGKTYTFTVLSDTTMKLETETAVATGRAPCLELGRKVNAHVFRSTRTDAPGLTATLYTSPQLRLLKGNIGPLQIELVTKRQALRTEKGRADLTFAVPVNGSIPAWSELDALTLRLRVQNDSSGKLFKDSAYGKILNAKPGAYHIRLTHIDPPAPCTERLPIKPDDPAARLCLEPALMYQSDHPEIRGAARRAIGTQTNALRAVRTLCAWVHEHLAQQSTKTATASALETLRSRAGDCSEHAALLCAMARSVGMPAREATGLTYRGGALWFHAWTEVYLGKRWIPVDATVNFVGLPAGSIRLDVRDGKTARAGALPALVSLMGKARADAVAATRRTETFNPLDPKQAVLQTKESYRDRRGDFAVDLRGGTQPIDVDGKIQFRTPDDLVITVQPLPSRVQKPEHWRQVQAALLKPLHKFHLENINSRRTAAGGVEAWITTFQGRSKKAPLAFELRGLTRGRRSLVVVVTGSRKTFQDAPDKVREAFARVTPCLPEPPPK